MEAGLGREIEGRGARPRRFGEAVRKIKGIGTIKISNE